MGYPNEKKARPELRNSLSLNLAGRKPN